MTLRSININHLSYSFDDDTTLFNDLSLSFGHGKKIGLVGDNGVGKSTLVKTILDGHPSIIINGKISYLPQNLSFAPTKDFILDANESDLMGGLHFLNLDRHFLGKDYSFMSGGEKVKFHLLKIILEDSDFIIMDEPTNNLDLNGKRILIDFINQLYGKTFIIISHDVELLNHMDEICHLGYKGGKIYGGNYDFFRKQFKIHQEKISRDINQQKSNLKKIKETEKKSIEKQNKRMKKGREKGVKSNMPKCMINFLKNKSENALGNITNKHDKIHKKGESKLSELKGELIEQETIKIDLKETEVFNHNKILSIKYFNKDFNGENLYPQNLTFDVYGPERIHLKGKNGSGKTTLFREIERNREDFIYVPFIYLDQDLSIVKKDLSLVDNLLEISSEMNNQKARLTLARFLFPRERFSSKAYELSGGELMRLAMAKTFNQKALPKLLMLDEPTNSLDLNSINVLIKTLNKFKGALIVITHDQVFADEIKLNRIISLL